MFTLPPELNFKTKYQTALCIQGSTLIFSKQNLVVSGRFGRPLVALFDFDGLNFEGALVETVKPRGCRQTSSIKAFFYFH